MVTGNCKNSRVFNFVNRENHRFDAREIYVFYSSITCILMNLSVLSFDTNATASFMRLRSSRNNHIVTHLRQLELLDVCFCHANKNSLTYTYSCQIPYNSHTPTLIQDQG